MKDSKKISEQHLFPYAMLFGVYVAMVVMAALLGAKLVQVGSVVFDSGLPIFAMSFFITDITSEVYGKPYSKKIMYGGLLGLIISMLCIKLSLSMPSSADWMIEKEFNTVFAMGNRIFIAAITVFILSQYVDITVFSWVKKKTKGKYFWLRNNISTFLGGVIDAFLFALIAFYGIYSMDVIIDIASTAYIVKIVIALIDTPFAYAGVWLLRKKYPELRD